MNEEKNTFHQNSPEWQLFENMKGAEAAARAFDADSEKYLRLAADSRDKAERFRKALAKLTADVWPPKD